MVAIVQSLSQISVDALRKNVLNKATKAKYFAVNSMDGVMQFMYDVLLLLLRSDNPYFAEDIERGIIRASFRARTAEQKDQYDREPSLLSMITAYKKSKSEPSSSIGAWSKSTKDYAGPVLTYLIGPLRALVIQHPEWLTTIIKILSNQMVLLEYPNADLTPYALTVPKAFVESLPETVQLAIVPNTRITVEDGSTGVVMATAGGVAAGGVKRVRREQDPQLVAVADYLCSRNQQPLSGLTDLQRYILITFFHSFATDADVLRQSNSTEAAQRLYEGFLTYTPSRTYGVNESQLKMMYTNVWECYQSNPYASIRVEDAIKFRDVLLRFEEQKQRTEPTIRTTIVSGALAVQAPQEVPPTPVAAGPTIEQLQAQIIAQQQQLALQQEQLQTLQQFQQMVEQAKSQANDLRSANAQLQHELNAFREQAQQREEQLQQQLEEMKKEAISADEDAAEAEQRAADAEQRIIVLEQQMQQVQQENTRLKEQIATLERTERVERRARPTTASLMDQTQALVTQVEEAKQQGAPVENVVAIQTRAQNFLKEARERASRAKRPLEVQDKQLIDSLVHVVGQGQEITLQQYRMQQALGQQVSAVMEQKKKK
jgi:hypothetical protein